MSSFPVKEWVRGRFTAQRCVGCQKWFQAKRADARACSATCRVDIARRGGAEKIRESVRRPLAWWDKVVGRELRALSVADFHRDDVLVVEVEPGMAAAVRAGRVTAQVVVVGEPVALVAADKPAEAKQ